MNIEEAKREIKNTARIYLLKKGEDYAIPLERQRPVLLIGAPGIGKTAIMKAISEELGLGFVSYTITHHTRQSAIGLPFISEKVYGGEKYSVTEYTMSEIVASVYDEIEKSGKKEGILFIDEINCVSETLAPAMLELLQRKKFGPHKIPDGWILTAAGNPNEYNRSANELDMVTLDRVKRINVEPDFDAFENYAVNEGVHGAIISFLKLHKDRLFKAERRESGFEFVTPRGWEDLSYAITEYEKLELKPSEEMILQYIQDRETASEFFVFYKIYEKFYQICGGDEAESGKIDRADLTDSTFEERFALAEYLRAKISTISSRAVAINQAANILRDEIFVGSTNSVSVSKKASEYGKKAFETTSPFKKSIYRLIIGVLSGEDPAKEFEKIVREAKEEGEKAAVEIANVLRFAVNSLGKKQETTTLVSSLTQDTVFIEFITLFRCDEFYSLNSELLIDDGGLKRKAKEALERSRK
ncbi:MAG: AAA family ATPase [Clostridia bacterium]|nr:AAA family ATPase [Clostridia bacterium]